MFDHILIPVDGSDFSRTALQYGIYIAKRLNARLTGLHVVDIKIIQGPLLGEIASYSGFPACYEFLPKIEEALEKRGTDILESFREECEKAGLVPDLKIVKGLIDEVIISEAESADCTILAQRGEHFHLTQGAFLGSTAEAVTRKSKKPVLITPGEFLEIESMALAYDGSAPADHALVMAADLSVKTKWPLTVVIVSDDQAVADKLNTKIETALDSYEIDSEVVVLRGREDKQLLQFIRDGSVELMIMGAFGRGRIRELFLGSTTSYIIRKSSIPVLLTH